MKTMRRFVWWPFLAGLLGAPACTGSAQTPEREDPTLGARLAPLAEAVAARGLVPGMQVAVVMRDGRLWSEALGVADLDTGRPVRPETRFYIASTSKALTALAATRMAQRGALDLDAPLSTAFPMGTRFHPDYDPSSATVRDLLTHTHGLQQGAISYRTAFVGDLTHAEFLELLPRHPPRPDRSFRYSNFGYDMVGLLLAPERDRGWKGVVGREVTAPLGMSHTTSARSDLADSLIAMPHEVARTGMARIRLAKDDANLGPAGGHFTTARDLARLLLAQLNEGRVDGEQVIEPEVIAETQAPQVSQDRAFQHYDRHAWGLGWDIGTVAGDTVVHRPGGFAGYYANAAFLPNHGFGVALLVNGGRMGSSVAEALARAIFDELRGRPDAASRLSARLDELEPVLEERAGEQRRLWAGVDQERLPAPPKPLDAYVGRYRHDLWGDAHVLVRDGALIYRSGMVESLLIPVDRPGPGDVFFAQITDDDDQVTFAFGAEERASELHIRGTAEAYVRQR